MIVVVTAVVVVVVPALVLEWCCTREPRFPSGSQPHADQIPRHGSGREADEVEQVVGGR